MLPGVSPRSSMIPYMRAYAVLTLATSQEEAFFEDSCNRCNDRRPPHKLPDLRFAYE